MNDQICILCRGKSMSLAEKYFKNLTNDMIIVNEFNEELKNSFVEELFISKKITHIVSADAGLSNLKEENYYKFDIKNVLLNRFSDQSKEINRMCNLIKKFGLTPSYLPDSMKPFQRPSGGFPTTGIISIVYSVVALGKKDIHVAGMDFYQGDYFINIKSNEHQQRKGLLMQSFLKNFISKSPGVKFTFYTNSMFNPQLKNVTIIKE